MPEIRQELKGNKITAKFRTKKSLPFQGGFLFNGADTQNRTGDLILTKDALYRLSHISTLTGKDHAHRVI